MLSSSFLRLLISTPLANHIIDIILHSAIHFCPSSCLPPDSICCHYLSETPNIVIQASRVFVVCSFSLRICYPIGTSLTKSSSSLHELWHHSTQTDYLTHSQWQCRNFFFLARSLNISIRFVIVIEFGICGRMVWVLRNNGCIQICICMCVCVCEMVNKLAQLFDSTHMLIVLYSMFSILCIPHLPQYVCVGRNVAFLPL